MTDQAQNVDEEQDPIRMAIMAELQQQGVAKVTIEFDGSCDEGQIDDITCMMLDGSDGSLDFAANIPGKTIPAGARTWSSKARAYITETSDRPATMAEVLDEWAYDLLEETSVDWVNGDGGFGEIIIIPAANLIVCDMNRRYTATQSCTHHL